MAEVFNEGPETIEYTVSGSEAGNRLDAFLAAKSRLSRNRLLKLIKTGFVLVDGARKKASFNLSAGQKVRATIPETAPSEVLAQNISLNILFEDSHIIVIDKPAGMVVHPAPGNSENTLVNALLYHCNDLSGIGGLERPGIVHRLDKDTSGVMVVAKNDLAHNSLTESFGLRKIKKNYVALAHGLPKEKKGEITLNIRRHKIHRKKMQVTIGADGRSAHTIFWVIKTYKDASLLKLTIKTGRTHQIRVHLASMGHPVIGDREYGGKKTLGKAPLSLGRKSVSRQMLHSQTLGFPHPQTGEFMEFTAPLPEDMKILINDLEKTA